MRGISGVVCIVAGLVLAGCGLGESENPPQPSRPASAPPTSVPVTTTPSPTATPTASTPSGKPTLPDDTDALDVSSYPSAHFADPTGRIRCAIYPDWALCHFSTDMSAKKIPKPTKICPGTGMDVTGVTVDVKAGYFCSGGAEALPQTEGLNVDWWRSTGFGSVNAEGQRLAVLPYGQKLANGRFVCASDHAGIRCGNTEARTGFLVSRTGVTFSEVAGKTRPKKN